MKVKGSWDWGVDYEAARKLIEKALAKAEGKGKCYSAIALIQLRNGTRVSEAVDAFMQFLATSAETVQVRVRKKKKEEYRMVVIPEAVRGNEEIREVCRELLNEDQFKVTERVRWWVREHFKFSTHALRYAFITEAYRRGWDHAVIAKITRHRNPSLLQHYVQQKLAEKILLDFE